MRACSVRCAKIWMATALQSLEGSSSPLEVHALLYLIVAYRIKKFSIGIVRNRHTASVYGRRKTATAVSVMKLFY